MNQRTDLGVVLRTGAATLSAGAAGIHFAVLPEHLAVYRPFGWFFFALGWFQMLWGAAVLRSPSRRTYLVGLVVNTLTIGLWLISRTMGLPVGPDAGTPEASEPVDFLATVFELLVVQFVAALLIAHPAFQIRLVVARFLIWLEVVLAVGGSAAVLLAAASGHAR